MMMMMSSNTVGNPDFNNISGAVPPPSRKVTLPKDKSPQLASSKPDSFERTPRDTAPEAPPTAETPAKTGGSSVIAIGLSAVSLIGAGIAGFLAFQKGGEAEAASKLAKAAQEDVAKLTKQLSETAGGVTEDDVTALIMESVEAVREGGQNAIKGINDRVDNLTKTVNGKADQTVVDILVQIVEGKVDKTKFESVKAEITTALGKKADQTQVENLERTVQAQGNKLVEHFPEVAGKSVDPTIWELFNPKATLPITTKARESLTGYLSEPPTVSNIELIKTAFEEAENLHQLLKILPDRVNNELQADNYHNQINTLRNSISSILDFYNDGELDSLTNKLNDTHFMIDFDREAIIAKTQAVVEATHKEGAKFDEVKTAQTELVTLLKETFGRSRLEQFKTDYPDAVMNFDDITTIPWVKKHIDENVLSKSNRQERFEALSAMFLVKEGALDGNHQDSPHTNVKVLADDIVPNLANALAEAYPEQLVDYNSGAIGLKTGVKSENLHPSLGALVATLQHLNNVFQPILPETGNYSPLLSVIAEEEIANFTEAQKLSYKMVQARLKGKSSEGQAEMANVTEQMNNLLRTQLKALNEGKSVVIAEAAEAVDSVLETLIQGIPETATYPSKQGVLPISTLGELAYVKKGMHTNNMLKSFSGQVEEKVRIDLGVTDLSQQEKIGRIINAVFNLKNGEAIDPLLEDLTNKPEIVDYVQNTIKQLSDPAYRLEEVKTIIIGLGQLIKEGLPTSIAE